MNRHLGSDRIRYPEISADLWELRFDERGTTLTGASVAALAMVFAGDVTVEPFRDHPTLLDTPIAVVDCSFIDPGTRVAARLGGHGHLSDWLELLPELACDTLVLGHLPPKTTPDSILARLPAELPGRAVVVPWVASSKAGPPGSVIRHGRSFC